MTRTRKHRTPHALIAAGLAATLGLAGLAGLAYAHGGKWDDDDDRRGAMMHGPMMQALMGDADTDGNGTISRDELAARALGLFDQVDGDGNGTLARREVREGMRGMMFQSIDANGDGMVSEDEFNAFGQTMGAHHGRMHGSGMGGMGTYGMGRGDHYRGGECYERDDDDRDDDDCDRHGYRGGHRGMHGPMRAAGMERGDVDGMIDRVFRRLDRDGSGAIEDDERTW